MSADRSRNATTTVIKTARETASPEDRAADPPGGRPNRGVVDRRTPDDGTEQRPAEQHASQRAGQLGGDVGGGVAPGQAAQQPQRHGDGGVEVPPELRGRGFTGPGGFLLWQGWLCWSAWREHARSWAGGASHPSRTGAARLAPRIRREHPHIGISLGQVSEHSRPRVMVVPDAFAGDEDGVGHELGRLERAEEERARLEVTQERTACSSRSATADRACRGNDRRRRAGRCSAADHSPHPASRCAD
jgi:hypothetical protein